MNIKDYLANPGGKGNAAFGQGTLIDSLDRKYARLLDAGKKFSYKIYKRAIKEEYYIHIVVPSETDRDNSYDVVVQFTDVDGAYKSNSSIADYDVRFFCNSPSFVYTFARAYYTNDLFVKDLSDKLPSDSLKKDSEVRNRYGIVNYDKYLYFASRYIYDSRLLDKATLKLRSIPYNKAYLNSKVRSFDKIMKEYRLAEKKAKESKEKGPDLTKAPHTKIKTFDASTIETKKKVPKKKLPKQPKSVKTVKKKQPIKKK